MKRLKLMTAILAMTALLVCTVALFSPYAPAVKPVPEIEEIWAIEDAREESDTPLVTALESNGMRLGYDAQENTFYCPIGLDNGEEWPELRLSAPGAKGVQLAFADDYTYDWCNEAVREGYAYQILAYTQEKFWYTQVVFTGLPVVCLKADSVISLEEQMGFAAISELGVDPIQTDARIRLRGAGSLDGLKIGYKVEFAGNSHGGQIEHDVPGIGMEGEIALLPMVYDKPLMRDKLSWEIYAALVGDDPIFAPRKTQHVELFVNDEYFGVYLMVNLMDGKRELALAGESHLREDSVYRSTFLAYYPRRERMTVDDPLIYQNSFGYDLRYTTKIGSEFADLQPYLALLTEEDDAVFARRALEMVDLDQLLRYVLFVQACGLTDNFNNNMYIWAEKKQDGRRYWFYPWDLDMSWGNRKDHVGKDFSYWLYFPFADRLINLDAGGARGRLAQIWQEMRAEIFTQENIAGMLERYAMELSESGAMVRNEMRWNMGMSYPDGQEILDFAGTRFPVMDEIIAMIAGTDERLPFLEGPYGELMGIPVFEESMSETVDRAEK